MMSVPTSAQTGNLVANAVTRSASPVPSPVKREEVSNGKQDSSMINVNIKRYPSRTGEPAASAESPVSTDPAPRPASPALVRATRPTSVTNDAYKTSHQVIQRGNRGRAGSGSSEESASYDGAEKAATPGNTAPNTTAPPTSPSPSTNSPSSSSGSIIRPTRPAPKVKPEPVPKEPQAIFSAMGGSLLRVTLPGLLDLFVTKIAEPAPSNTDLLLIDQVLITHRYWSNTMELIKCFTKAVSKVTSDTAMETSQQQVRLVRITNVVKTFLTYFDVSSYDGSIDELLGAVRTAQPTLADHLQSLVANNIAAFATHTGSIAPNSAMATKSEKEGVSNVIPHSVHRTESSSSTKYDSDTSLSDSDNKSGKSPVRSIRGRGDSSPEGVLTASASSSDRQSSGGVSTASPSSVSMAVKMRMKTSAAGSRDSLDLEKPYMMNLIATLQSPDMPDIEVLAQQMALADWKHFSNCVIVDFMHASFLKKKDNSVAQYIEHTNLTTRWIAGKIITAPNARARGKMLGYFIRLMEILKDLQDYTGMINIFTTLSTNSIWKIRKSWKHVDAKRQKAFNKFEAIVQPMINFSGYRELLSKSKPPAVPALAILTKDMVALEEQPTYCEDDDGNPTAFLNWAKFAQIAGALTEHFLRLVKTAYQTEPLDGLFDELMDPNVLNSHSDGSPGTNDVHILLTEEEISILADRVDAEEQGILPVQPEKTPNSSPPSQAVAVSTRKRPSALGLYLGGASAAQPSPSGKGKGSQTSPPNFSLGASMTGVTKDKDGVVQLSIADDNVERVASVAILRRTLTSGLINAHVSSESLSDAQRGLFESQSVQHQRDSYVRMLRCIDLALKYANANIFAHWNAHHGEGKQPHSSKSATSISAGLHHVDVGAFGFKYSGNTEFILPSFITDMKALAVPRPHGHVLEFLNEGVRLFQKFDGVTKIRNMMRPSHETNSAGVGKSLLSDDLGVIALLSLSTRTLIYAFLAVGMHYFSNSLPTSARGDKGSSSTPTTSQNLFFDGYIDVERVGISLQISISGSEGNLPRNTISLPNAGVSASPRAFVQRILASLPLGLAELFLPFETLLEASSASVAYFPEGAFADDLSASSTSSQSSSSQSKRLSHVRKTSDEAPAASNGCIVLGIALPLGSYASTIASIGLPQKKLMASRLVGVPVDDWKLEHVVTWLKLTGNGNLCAEFEHQSISGSELLDLEPSDFETMGMRITPAQTKTLMQNIRQLQKTGAFDGHITTVEGETAYASGSSLPLQTASDEEDAADLRNGADSSDDDEHELKRPPLGRMGSVPACLSGSLSGSRSGSLRSATPAATPSPTFPVRGARMRVLEGNKCGIISFAKESDFTLAKFLDKAGSLFNTSYDEMVDLTYYDLDGDSMSLTGSQTFSRQAEMVWEDLCREGSIDVVYTSITLRAPTSTMSPSGSSIDLRPKARGPGSPASVRNSDPSLRNGDPEMVRSGSSSSVGTPPTVTAVDYPTKYANQKGIFFALDAETGNVLYASAAVTSQVSSQPLVGKCIDSFVCASAADVLEACKRTQSMNALMATEKGVRFAELKLSYVTGLTAPIVECAITLEEDDMSGKRSIELTKLKEAAAKCPSPVIVYSQKYGIIQFGNRPALLFIGSDILQGTLITGIMPHGTPSASGDTTLPVQKKDGTLAVATFRVRFFTGSSDSLIVLTSIPR